MSVNGTQFSSKDFEKNFKTHSIVHLTSPLYLPLSNGMVERFVDLFKRAIKKASGIETVNEELQKFLSIYPKALNVNASSGMVQAELMFPRKNCSVFDKLRATEKKIYERKNR